MGMNDYQKAIETKVASLEEVFLNGLQRILKIPSVKGPAEKEAPFGCEPKKAIIETLMIAEELGFRTEMVNNAMGYAELGEGEDYLGVFGHLDVVEAGTGWSVPPFDLTCQANKLYGRGVLDNKGPILSNLFALYALKELQVPLDKKIRIVFGSDEESGSADIDLYLEQERPPLYGYTPDCKYPAVYGERGILDINIQTPFSMSELAEISSIDGHFNRAMIPDFIRLTTTAQASFEIIGKRAPSNAPELGENAITLMANQISEGAVVTNPRLQAYFHWVSEAFHQKHDGAGLGIQYQDEDSGALQLSPYGLLFEKDSLTLQVSFRYPINVSEEQLMTAIQGQLFVGSTVKINRSLPSTVFPKEHPMLMVMQEVYQQVTGLDGRPVTTTGATYARKMPNIVAFGPSFPGQKGIAHNQDEYMFRTDLLKNMEIYAKTLFRLANLP